MALQFIIKAARSGMLKYITFCQCHIAINDTYTDSLFWIEHMSSLQPRYKWIEMKIIWIAMLCIMVCMLYL